MADGGAQTTEKNNYKLRDQEIERWREIDRDFYLDLDLDLTQKF